MYFFYKKKKGPVWYKCHFIFLWKKAWNMSWHSKPTLPLIDLHWQHSNASQSGWVFVPWRQCSVLRYPRCTPEHASLTMAIFEHVHVGYRCIYRHDLRVHMWALQAENTLKKITRWDPTKYFQISTENVQSVCEVQHWCPSQCSMWAAF